MIPLSFARAAICAARMSSELTSPQSLSSANSSGNKNRLELRGRLARLRAVGLVRDDSEPLAVRRRELAHFLQRERKGLDRASHDFLAPGERRRQLPALARALARGAPRVGPPNGPTERIPARSCPCA